MNGNREPNEDTKTRIRLLSIYWTAKGKFLWILNLKVDIPRKPRDLSRLFRKWVGYAIASVALIATCFVNASDSGWVYLPPITTNGTELGVELSDLQPCTEYEVQASLDPDFQSGRFATFKTSCD